LGQLESNDWNMNLQIDSGAKKNAGLVCPTRRIEAGPQLDANIRAICPPARPDAQGGFSPIMPVTSAGADAVLEAGERIDLAHDEDARAKLASLRGSKRARPDMGWLARDPSEWSGRKIRHRLTGKVYEIRTVFVTGRVELQKTWMTYMSHVWTVRAEFEPYSA
jgi:hypothetical protein